MRRLTPALALALSLPLAGQAQEPPRPSFALAVGTVHPVSGEAYQDGILLVGGGRILAAGPRGKVAVPQGVPVLAYPTGHAYPGLIDAASQAFVPGPVAETDAGTEGLGTLDPYARGAAAVEGGITTAHVSPPSTGRWRGIGAIVRPRAVGFEPWAGVTGAVHMDLVAPTGAHPLARAKDLADLDRPFEELAAYRKQFEQHKAALAKYEKDFAAYLEALKARGGEARPEGGRRGRRGEGGDGGEGGGRTRGGEGAEGRGARGNPPEGAPRPATEGAAPAPAPAGPTRPTYPKAPSSDPAKDALGDVADGKRPLRVAAQRRDEIRAALELIDGQDLRRVTLSGAAEAGAFAAELARRGIAVVLTPTGAPAELDGERVPETLAADLHRAGVRVAIASGDVERSRFLPLLAACCAGDGLPADAAVRAITLTAAEILGIADQTGSLDVGKRADILITSAPLLASDARVLRVLADGETLFQDR